MSAVQTSALSLRDPFAHVRAWPIPVQLKYFAARHAFKHAEELLPPPDDYKFQRRGRSPTWRTWWERRFKQRLGDYIDWLQQHPGQMPPDKT